MQIYGWWLLWPHKIVNGQQHSHSLRPPWFIIYHSSIKYNVAHFSFEVGNRPQLMAWCSSARLLSLFGDGLLLLLHLQFVAPPWQFSLILCPYSWPMVVFSLLWFSGRARRAFRPELSSPWLAKAIRSFPATDNRYAPDLSHAGSLTCF